MVSEDSCLLGSKQRISLKKNCLLVFHYPRVECVCTSEGGDEGSRIGSAISFIRGRSMEFGSASRGGRGPRVHGVVRARMVFPWSRNARCGWSFPRIGRWGARHPRRRVCPRLPAQRILTRHMCPLSRRSLMLEFCGRGKEFWRSGAGRGPRLRICICSRGLGPFR